MSLLKTAQCAGVGMTAMLLCCLLLCTASVQAQPDTLIMAQPESVLLSPSDAQVRVTQTLQASQTEQGWLLRMLLPGDADNVTPDVAGRAVLRWRLLPVVSTAQGQAARERQRLLEEISALDARLVALDTALSLYRLPPEGTATAVTDLKEAGRQLMDDVTSLHEERLSVKRCLKQLQDMQASLPALPDRGRVLEILLADAPAAPVNVTCTYTLPNCGWRPRYSLNAHPATGSITARMLADVWQYSGQDWSTCRLSLVNIPAGSLRPADLPRWDIEKTPPMPRREAAAAVLAAPKAMMASDSAPRVNVVESGAFLRWDLASPGLPQGRFTLVVAQEEWKAPMSWLARPAEDEQRVWMTARHTFADGPAWPRGLMECLIDGQSAGTGIFSPEQGEVTLFFGADPRVTVKVLDTSRRQADDGIINARRLWQWSWVYTLHNERQNDIEVRVERPMPRNVEESVQVRLHNVPEARQDADGRTLYWNVRVPAGQTAEIRHDVEISAPADMPLAPVAP